MTVGASLRGCGGRRGGVNGGMDAGEREKGEGVIGGCTVGEGVVEVEGEEC